jgi:beta-N-acetylhexosaminidase
VRRAGKIAGSELERLAGSVFCVGVPGDRLGDDDRRNLAALRPGGIVLFGRNVSTLAATRALLHDAREAIGGDRPALGCIDQEGGRVVRLRFAAEALPSMMALGAADDVELAERAGGRLANELRAIGANVNFAPVLDLALEQQSSVVGGRALGSDPQAVARLGAALVRGLQRRGVVATPKHFPGHGATPRDSHVELPVVDADLATLRSRELVPFAAAFAARARAVMSVHVVVQALDPERPATLSPQILTVLLRGEMGFEGVCFTDCLMMDAIARTVGTVEGTLQALAAGADVALISHDLALARAARDAVVAAVSSGALPLARLEEAAARVARLQSLAAVAAQPVDFLDDDLAREIARRGLRVVRGEPRIDLARPVTVISFEGDVSDGIAKSDAQRPSLSLALRRRRAKSELMRVPLAPDDAMLEMLLEVARAQGDRQFVLVARRAHRYPLQGRALDALLTVAPDAIAVSALEPFDLVVLNRARTLVATYGDELANLEVLADLLAGPGPNRGNELDGGEEIIA